MTIDERIKDLEKDIKICFDENSLNSIQNMKEHLRRNWNEAKKDDGLLAQAIKVNRNDKGKATEICSSIIASLILLDYKEVDPLIYDTLINIIYNNPSIASIPNSLLSEKKYSFLTSTLFNEELKLSDSRKKLLLEEATQYSTRIVKLLNAPGSGIANLDYMYDRNKTFGYTTKGVENAINTTLNELNTILLDRRKNINFANTPIDIRYFISIHPMFSGLQEDSKWADYFKNFFISRSYIYKDIYNDKLKEVYNDLIISESMDYSDFNMLFEDAVERVSIRKYIKMPF